MVCPGLVLVGREGGEEQHSPGVQILREGGVQGPFGERHQGREQDSVRSRGGFPQVKLGLTRVGIPAFIIKMIKKSDAL